MCERCSMCILGSKLTDKRVYVGVYWKLELSVLGPSIMQEEVFRVYLLPSQFHVNGLCRLLFTFCQMDSWAICRIFKKNTIAQRALSHGWAPPLVERRVDQSSSPMNSDMLSDKCIGVDSFIPREDLSTETRNSSNLSSHTGDQCCKNDHQTLQPKNAEVPMQQQASYVDSSSGLGYKMEAKSMSTNFPGSRSMSLPNLEVPMSSYFSHHVDPFSVKGTLDFVSCMLQMSPIAEFGGRSHNLVDATTANLAAPRTNLHQNVSSFQHQQTDGISADHVFLKKNVSPRPGIIPLPYPSHLYEVLKAVSWDTPTSTVEISSTNDAN